MPGCKVRLLPALLLPLLAPADAMHAEHGYREDTEEVHRNVHFRAARVREVAGGGGGIFLDDANKHIEAVGFHSEEAGRHNADKMRRMYARFDRNNVVERQVDDLSETDPPPPPMSSRAALARRAQRHHGDGGAGGDAGNALTTVGGSIAHPRVHGGRQQHAHAHVPHAHAHNGNLAAALGTTAPPHGHHLKLHAGKLLISNPDSGDDAEIEVPASRRFRDEIAAYRHDHRHHVKDSWGMAHERVPHQLLEASLERNQHRSRVTGSSGGGHSALHKGGYIEVLHGQNPDTYVGEDGIMRRHSETPLPGPHDKYRVGKDDMRRFLPEYRHHHAGGGGEEKTHCTHRGHTTVCHMQNTAAGLQQVPVG